MSRAATISADFAAQFKQRIEGQREKDARIPIAAQADFAYLVKAAKELSGKEAIGEEMCKKRRDILRGLIRAVPRYVQIAA